MRSFQIVFSTACMNDQTISKVSFSYFPRKERTNTVGTKMCFVTVSKMKI